jgi:dihydroorotate dehydrogenase
VRVLVARDEQPEGQRRPVLLKIAPDLALEDLDDVVRVARRRGVDGMIIGNTTLSRPSTLKEQATAREAGGLSGTPLFPLATRMLAETYVRAEKAFPLIGVGGIDSGEAALAKIEAGATLIQLYSGLVFHGLSLIRAIKEHLLDELSREGQASLAPLIGRSAGHLVREPWPDGAGG